MKTFTFLIIIILVSTTNAYSFIWVGHRGTRGNYPENTIQGMREALKYPEIKTLELDIVISKDGEVVVSHEPWMNPVICLTPQGGAVKAKADNFYKMTYAQIAAFDCGSKFYPDFPNQVKTVEHKPRLIDLLRAVEFEARFLGKRPAYFIEIKSTKNLEKDGYQPSVPIIMEKVIAVLEQTLTDEQIYIISLDWRALIYAHKKRPQWKTVALGTTPLSAAGIVHRLGFTPTVYAPFYPIYPKLGLKAFKKRGIKIIPWTVNKSNDMQKLIDKGVDGIITDYPDLISEVEIR